MMTGLRRVLAVTTAGGALVLAFAAHAPGAAILSTDFSTTTSDQVPVDGTARTVGVKTNWTVADSTKVDVVSVTSFTAGSTTYGSVSDAVDRGKWITMLGDGSYISGSVNANARTNSGINLQFNSTTVGTSTNSAPLDMGIFTFVFEVKDPITQLSATFDMGTGTTSGGWYSADAAQNGYYNVRIVGIGNSTDFTFYSTAQAAGAGAPYAATAVDQTNTQLGVGIYRLEVQMSDKTQNQRYTIDNFSLSAVPEPTTVGLLGAAGLVVLRRRQRV